MKWCCPNFKSWHEAAGERGYTVFAEPIADGKSAFVVQYRAVDIAQEHLVSSQTPLTLLADIRISYCPWCGRDLAKWYGRNTEELYKPSLKITY